MGLFHLQWEEEGGFPNPPMPHWRSLCHLWICGCTGTDSGLPVLPENIKWTQFYLEDIHLDNTLINIKIPGFRPASCLFRINFPGIEFFVSSNSLKSHLKNRWAFVEFMMDLTLKMNHFRVSHINNEHHSAGIKRWILLNICLFFFKRLNLWKFPTVEIEQHGPLVEILPCKLDYTIHGNASWFTSSWHSLFLHVELFSILFY